MKQPNKIEMKQSRIALFKDRNFTWTMSGAAISMLGDQFTLIALPWLVLKMTGDTFALGIVLALMGIPRALLLLIGGALVDRYSPKSVMMLTKYINTVLLGVLALLVLQGSLQLWMVNVLAFCLGVSTAFSIPSGMAMMPRVVQEAHLPVANSMILGLRQLTMFIGPVLAGLMIALFGDAASGIGKVSDANGLGAAFLFDCLSYAISAWTLSHVVMNQLHASAELSATEKPRQAILQSVLEGLRYCWNEPQLRTCFAYWSAIAFFIMGPIQIAIPFLANQIGNNASALGFLAGAHGAGTLIGMLLSGMKPNLRFGNLGNTVLLIDFMVGILFMPMGLVNSTWQAALILLCIGGLGGFIHVAIFTWMQRQVPREMIGRAMSMFMFIFIGIGPISAAITGWLMRSIQLKELFLVSGGLLLLIVLLALPLSSMRKMSDHSRANGASGI
ncbi:MAG: MFS transporter [Pseudomonadota bacterium]